MLLYEFEAKQLLAQYGIGIPRQFGVYQAADSQGIDFPAIAKVQILQGKRQKRGGVVEVASIEELHGFTHAQLSHTYNNEAPYGVLVEKRAEPGTDVYVSVIYEADDPVLIVNAHGGVDVEEAAQHSIRIPIDALNQTIAGKLPSPLTMEFVSSLLKCFFIEDCRQIEINPLRILSDGTMVALDVKMILDDRALYRHADRTFVEKISIRTEREKQVDEINQNPEYTGSPCRYVELNGDIATLLSGGGASLVIFDALVMAGLNPGNYSEYSGNPNKEKVEKLTRVVLSKPEQRGLLIAGGIANFTMIDETLSGVATALESVKPAYPIVVRRGGPGEAAAKNMMHALAQKHHLDITWFGSETSITEACDFFIKKVGTT